MPRSVSFKLDKSGMDAMIRRVAAGKKAVGEPFGETRGKDAATILRFGQRGISDQFADETEYIGRSARPWLPSSDFGRTPAPRKTMDRNGRYRAAWLGGPGGKTSISANVLTIGVERSLFPQVAIHQSNRHSTLVKPRKRSSTRPKDFAMRFYLGLVHGVWISISRLRRGLKIQRRRLSVSQDVRSAIGKLVGVQVKARIRKVKTQEIVRPR